MRGYPHLLFVLAVSQTALAVVAALGEVVFVGSGIYLIVPVLRGLLLLIAAGRAARPRRGPLIVVIVLEHLSVFGFFFGLLVGLLPWVSDTVNLVGLLTNLVLPWAMIYLAAMLLGNTTTRRYPRPPAITRPYGLGSPPVDPWPYEVPAVTRILPRMVGSGQS